VPSRKNPFVPIGHSKETAVNVRIVSATHKDLAAEVDAGRFRQDLFYRINVIQVKVPPLRDRGDDILYLAQRFLKKLSADWGVKEPALGDAARQALQRYAFPGNVRELQNILERALTLCDTATITPDHLQLPVGHPMPVTATPASATGSAPAISATENHNGSLEDYLFEIEKTAILKALEDTRWNRTAAARKLGMTFRSLRYRLKKMGLDDEEEE
jgi:two-component system response regulator PilR (NtrC family)